MIPLKLVSTFQGEYLACQLNYLNFILQSLKCKYYLIDTKIGKHNYK